MNLDTPETRQQMALMSRPIPGSSLTRDPNSPWPWEKTPEFTVIEEALEYIFDEITQEERYEVIIDSIINNTTIMEIVQMIVYAGFVNGKWNPDLLTLLMEPVTYMVMALAERAGIEYRLDNEEDPNDENRVGALPKPNITPDNPPEEVAPFLDEIEQVKPPSLLEKVE